MPEAGVDKVARHVLHSAVVPVDREPVFKGFLRRKCLVVVRVGVPEEVPRRPRPLRHGVCFPLCRSAALRAGAVNKRVYLCKRAFSALSGSEILHLRQLKRKLVIWHADDPALRTVNYRYRLAPVALTVERPVLHFVLNALLAHALFLKELKHLRNSFLLRGNAVKEAGVDHLTVAGISRLGNVSALYDLDYVDAELLGKVVIAIVMRRNSHYRAGAVAHHNVV